MTSQIALRAKAECAEFGFKIELCNINVSKHPYTWTNQASTVTLINFINVGDVAVLEEKYPSSFLDTTMPLKL